MNILNVPSSSIIKIQPAVNFHFRYAKEFKKCPSHGTLYGYRTEEEERKKICNNPTIQFSLPGDEPKSLYVLCTLHSDANKSLSPHLLVKSKIEPNYRFVFEKISNVNNEYRWELKDYIIFRSTIKNYHKSFSEKEVEYQNLELPEPSFEALKGDVNILSKPKRKTSRKSIRNNKGSDNEDDDNDEDEMTVDGYSIACLGFTIYEEEIIENSKSTYKLFRSIEYSDRIYNGDKLTIEKNCNKKGFKNETTDVSLVIKINPSYKINIIMNRKLNGKIIGTPKFFKIKKIYYNAVITFDVTPYNGSDYGLSNSSGNDVDDDDDIEMSIHVRIDDSIYRSNDVKFLYKNNYKPELPHKRARTTVENSVEATTSKQSQMDNFEWNNYGNQNGQILGVGNQISAPQPAGVPSAINPNAAVTFNNNGTVNSISNLQQVVPPNTIGGYFSTFEEDINSTEHNFTISTNEMSNLGNVSYPEQPVAATTTPQTTNLDSIYYEESDSAFILQGDVATIYTTENNMQQEFVPPNTEINNTESYHHEQHSVVATTATPTTNSYQIFFEKPDSIIILKNDVATNSAIYVTENNNISSNNEEVIIQRNMDNSQYNIAPNTIGRNLLTTEINDTEMDHTTMNEETIIPTNDNSMWQTLPYQQQQWAPDVATTPTSETLNLDSTLFQEHAPQHDPNLIESPTIPYVYPQYSVTTSTSSHIITEQNPQASSSSAMNDEVIQLCDEILKNMSEINHLRRTIPSSKDSIPNSTTDDDLVGKMNNLNITDDRNKNLISPEIKAKKIIENTGGPRRTTNENTSWRICKTNVTDLNTIYDRVLSDHKSLQKFYLTIKENPKQSIIKKIRNTKGENFLHYACQRNKAFCIRPLVGLGCRLNMQDSYGRTPLHIAVEYQLHDCIREVQKILGHLYEKYPNEIQENVKQMFAVYDDNGFTVLHAAINSNMVDLVKVMLDFCKQNHINVLDYEVLGTGDSIGHLVVQQNLLEMMQLIRDYVPGYLSKGNYAGDTILDLDDVSEEMEKILKEAEEERRK